MSPLSDTTNLAPAMVGSDLISHIKYMMWTTIPSYYYYINNLFNYRNNLDFKNGEINQINAMQNALSGSFNISIFIFACSSFSNHFNYKKNSCYSSFIIGGSFGRGCMELFFNPILFRKLVMTLLFLIGIT